MRLVIEAAERRYRELLNQASEYQAKQLYGLADETAQEHVRPLRAAIDQLQDGVWVALWVDDNGEPNAQVYQTQEAARRDFPGAGADPSIVTLVKSTIQD